MLDVRFFNIGRGILLLYYCYNLITHKKTKELIVVPVFIVYQCVKSDVIVEWLFL
jgi:hypothetical protein